MVMCCNGDCDQGRRCPLRVARVKARYPRYPDCESPSHWRERVRGVAWWVLFALLNLLYWSAFFLVIQ